MDHSSREKDLEVEAADINTTDDNVSLNPTVVRSLRRKADFILLPVLSFAYLLKYAMPWKQTSSKTVWVPTSEC